MLNQAAHVVVPKECGPWLTPNPAWFPGAKMKPWQSKWCSEISMVPNATTILRLRTLPAAGIGERGGCRPGGHPKDVYQCRSNRVIPSYMKGQIGDHCRRNSAQLADLLGAVPCKRLVRSIISQVAQQTRERQFRISGLEAALDRGLNAALCLGRPRRRDGKNAK